MLEIWNKNMADAKILLCKPTMLRMIFNPNAWDNDYCGQFNCYAYALNVPRAGFALPGELMSAEPVMSWHLINKDEIIAALIKDGLEEITEKQAFKSDARTIALRISRDDFHFLRKDIHGLWSHKLGERRPSDTSHGKPIQNPRLGRYAPYNYFCGYFSVPDKGIPYLPRIEIPADTLKAMASAYPK